MVGVNCYQNDNGPTVPLGRAARPCSDDGHVERFKAFKEERSPSNVAARLDALARAANSKDENVFERIVEATEAGVTHGEIVGCLRKELGFGHPLVTV